VQDRSAAPCHGVEYGGVAALGVGRWLERLPVDAAPRTLDYFPATAFDRIDPRPDATFYDSPRLVVHIDAGAIGAVGELVRRRARACST
jgi:hypothetical protein